IKIDSDSSLLSCRLIACRAGLATAYLAKCALDHSAQYDQKILQEIRLVKGKPKRQGLKLELPRKWCKSSTPVSLFSAILVPACRRRGQLSAKSQFPIENIRLI